VRYAITLEGRPLSVFPCRDKRPTCLNGHNAATADPAKIADLFRRYVGTQIGVPTGQSDGFDCLDIDPRSGGDRWFHQNRGRIPQTRTHETPSGGFHMLFRPAPGLRCSTSKIAPGVDVKANGGYIIWHPASLYRVLCEGPLAEWPEWLLDLAGRSPSVSVASVAAALPTQPAYNEKREEDGPQMAGTDRRVPKALYFKVLDLVPLSATVTGRDQRRVLGILRMVTQQRQNRNGALNVAAFCFRELIGSGVVSRAAAECLLLDAATLNGYVAKDGLAAATATIRSGLGPSSATSGPSIPFSSDEVSA
jgi:Bifunctional DNA primase/polymerase, N-terminal